MFLPTLYSRTLHIVTQRLIRLQTRRIDLKHRKNKSKQFGTFMVRFRLFLLKFSTVNENMSKETLTLTRSSHKRDANHVFIKKIRNTCSFERVRAMDFLQNCSSVVCPKSSAKGNFQITCSSFYFDFRGSD